MKRTAWGTRLLIALLSLLTLSYFGVQGFRYFADPFSTTLAYLYEAEETMDLSGYVVRSEQTLPDVDSPFLRLRRSEGERVSAGGTVAVVYADQESLDMQAEAASIAARLEQLSYARDMSQGIEVAARLDRQIFSALLEYRSALTADRLDKAERQGTQIRSLVRKRDYSHENEETLEEEIAALESRLESVQQRSERVARNITAPESGLYSAVTDGYEGVLTPERVRNLTPSALSALMETENREDAARSPLGKLVLGDAWYYAASLSAADAETLRQRAQKESGWKLRFSKSVERDFPVTLDWIGAEENGRVLALFRCRQYLSEVTILRRQKAQIIFGTVEGLRTPKEALRMTTGDEDAAMGLYCVVGTEARFKPVEVLYTGENFLLVRSTASSESLRLRPGDEIIVRAEGIYDGKVVTGTG